MTNEQAAAAATENPTIATAQNDELELGYAIEYALRVALQMSFAEDAGNAQANLHDTVKERARTRMFREVHAAVVEGLEAEMAADASESAEAAA